MEEVAFERAKGDFSTGRGIHMVQYFRRLTLDKLTELFSSFRGHTVLLLNNKSD